MENFYKFFTKKRLYILFFLIFFVILIFIPFFIIYITIGSAREFFFGNLTTEYLTGNELEEIFRNPRKLPTPKPSSHIWCSQFFRTDRYPYVVLMLYRKPGHFVGMGSIINRETVLTAKRVVQKSLSDFPTLIVLPGRIIPSWTDESEVRKAREIHVNDVGLALVRLNHKLSYYIGFRPIPLAISPSAGSPKVFRECWGTRWAVFGIPLKRGQRAGEALVGSDYVMKVEDLVRDEDAALCESAYPDVELKGSAMFCSHANASFGWGCVGSPVISSREGRIQQVGVVLGSGGEYAEAEEYHLLVAVGPYKEWINSHISVS